MAHGSGRTEALDRALGPAARRAACSSRSRASTTSTPRAVLAGGELDGPGRGGRCRRGPASTTAIRSRAGAARTGRRPLAGIVRGLETDSGGAAPRRSSTPSGKEALVPFVAPIVVSVDERDRPHRDRPAGRPARTLTVTADHAHRDPDASFPRYFESPLAESLLGKGIAAGLIEVVVTDLRAFSPDKHRKVDDEPYGGGPGMVMTAPVVAAAVEARRGGDGRAWSVLLTPDGDAARPGAARGARAPAEPPALLRPLRGNRRAGAAARPLRRGDLARRLRSPGRRGRRARGRRGALAARAGSRRQAPSPSSGSPSPATGSTIPHYTRPREFRGHGRARTCSSRATTPGSSAGAGRAPSSARGSAAPTCSRRRPEEPGEGERMIAGAGPEGPFAPRTAPRLYCAFALFFPAFGVRSFRNRPGTRF